MGPKKRKSQKRREWQKEEGKCLRQREGHEPDRTENEVLFAAGVPWSAGGGCRTRLQSRQ